MKQLIPVVYIITKLELGGAQKVCLSLFNHFSKIGKAWLISGTQGPLVQEVINKKNVFLLSSLKRSVGFSDFKAFYDIYHVLKKLKKENSNIIVHTHSTKAGYLGRWAAWFAGIKIIIHTVHGFGFHPYQSKIGYLIAYLLELFTSTITTQYICVSSYDSALGKKMIPHFNKKEHIIRAAIENKAFIPATKTILKLDTYFIFGTISCFKKQKNLFDLLNAFKIVHMRNKKTHLEVIGNGELAPVIKDWITQENLQHAITLHGWQSHVAPFMHTWHAFVLSSLWEGLPCSIIEARALKLPVLCYNVGGIKDIITHGKNGLLYQPHDIQGLAHGMLLLTTDKSLYTSLALHPQNLQPFTYAVMHQQHNTIYQKHVSP